MTSDLLYPAVDSQYKPRSLGLVCTGKDRSVVKSVMRPWGALESQWAEELVPMGKLRKESGRPGGPGIASNGLKPTLQATRPVGRD